MGNASSGSLYSSGEEEEEEETEHEEEEEEEHFTVDTGGEPWFQGKQRLYSYVSEEEEEEYSSGLEETTSPVLGDRHHNIHRYSMPRRRGNIHYDVGAPLSSDEEEDDFPEQQQQHQQQQQRQRSRPQKRSMRYSPSPDRTVVRSRADCERLIMDLRFDESNRILGRLEEPNEDYDLVDVPNGRVGVFACSRQAIPGTNLLLDLIMRCKREVVQLETRKEKLRLQVQDTIATTMKRRKCDKQTAIRVTFKSEKMRNIRIECARVDKKLVQFQGQYTAVMLRYDNLVASAKNIRILEDEKEATEQATSVLPTPEDITDISKDIMAEQDRMDESIQSMNDAREEMALGDGTAIDLEYDSEFMDEINDFLLGFDESPSSGGSTDVTSSKSPEERIADAPPVPVGLPTGRSVDAVVMEEETEIKRKKKAVAAF